jgi:colicin import membrane protein
MLSLRGSIFLSAFSHVVLFLALLLFSSTGGARVVYKPQYQVRLVRPQEIPSLAKPPPKKAAKPKPPAKIAKPEAKKVVLPEKKDAPPKKKEIQKPPPEKKRSQKKAEKKPQPKPSPAAKPREPAPEEVLEEALTRIEKRAGSREKLAANMTESASSRWEEKQKEIEYSAYYDKVERAVRENWIPPQDMDLEKGSEMTVVSLTLLPDGRVLKSYVEESSGDPHFDQSVMRAILKSTPFPPPPIGLKQQSFELGLRFHSTPQTR